MKKKIIASALLMGLSFNALAIQESVDSKLCFSEKGTISTMEKQIDAAKKELVWLQTNRASSLTNDLLGTLVYGTFIAAMIKDPGERGIVLTHASALGTQLLSGAYNFKVSSDQIEGFQSLVQNLEEQVRLRSEDVKNGKCTMTKVLTKASKSEQLNQAMYSIVELNKLLADASLKMTSELGNIGTRSTTVVSIGLNVLVALAMKKQMATAGFFTLIGTLVHIADSGSLYLSRKEARPILSEINSTLIELEKQEKALASILDAEKLLE